LLWDLGPDVTVTKLTRLLRKCFRMLDQAEWFQMELQTRKHKAGEELQSLYNDICHLMSLGYPGPLSDLMNVMYDEKGLAPSIYHGNLKVPDIG